MTARLPTIDVLGVPLARLTVQAALDEAVRLYDAEEPATIFHANAHTLNSGYRDPSYREVLRRADLVLNDGKGTLIAGLLLRARFPADLNGNLVTPLLLEVAARRAWPVYLLGAAPGVAERAAGLLPDRIPGLNIVGTRDGHFPAARDAEVAAAVRRSGAGLLLVGMGNPRQERWLDRHIGPTGARLGVGVGAFFDFQTGTVPRAPGWMNRIGLEWLHRLAQDPRRMWRRYLLGNPLFVWRVLRGLPAHGR